MAENISVSCNTACVGACLSCTGTCLGVCRNSCDSLCVSKATSGIFGFDDDYYTGIHDVATEKPSSCTTCTGTCIDKCGNDCEGKCSNACKEECTGDCKGTCTLGCEKSCFDTCEGHCGDTCETGCKLDCTDSCMGVCSGCTGCSNMCKNECENQCIYSCVGNSTSAENGGMLDFSDATMEEILRSLKWKKISEFPLSPTILNDDQFAVVDDPSKAEVLDKLSVLLSENPSINPLETMDLENTDMITTDYSLKTVRVTAATFVEYLSTHIKNFVLWYPVYNSETHELSWIRRLERPTNDDAPPPIDLLDMVADIAVATDKHKGLMSAQDKKDLDNLVKLRNENYYVTQDEFKVYKQDVSDEFTKITDDFDGKLTNYVKTFDLTTTLSNYYTKKDANDLFVNIGTYNTGIHSLGMSINNINGSINTINSSLDKAYNNVALSNTVENGKQTISGEAFPQSSGFDHVTITKTYTFTSRDGTTKSIDIPYEYYKYRIATSEYGGLLSKEGYNKLYAEIPTTISTLEANVPSIVRSKVKVGELANDIGYLTASTLPISTDAILGGVKVANDSRISVDTDGFINTKDFSAINMIKNSTFALGEKYWNKSDNSVAIVSEFANNTNASCGKLIMPRGGTIMQTISSTYGRYMTLSFDMMGTSILKITIKAGTSTVVLEENIGGSTWFHYSKVIALDSSSLVDEASISLIISNSGAGASDSEFYLKNIMLQNGMYDTGWTPNPYDGNAVIGFEMPYKIDNKTIILNDGVISSPSEIDDSPLIDPSTFSDTAAFSTNGTKSYIPLYIGSNSLNMTKQLRFTQTYNSTLGYGLILEQTNKSFMIRVTDAGDALGNKIRQKAITETDADGNETTVYKDDIPFRIDLQSNTCDINGKSMDSEHATMSETTKCDYYGRVIHDTYVTVDEFNSVLDQLKTAIAALIDIST